MEWLRAGYTEVWTPSAVVPLVQFGDRVRAIADTGLDLIGLDGVDAPLSSAEALAQFDEIVSWYGTNRRAFREAARSLNPNWRFLPALPPENSTLHVTDFYAQTTGAPLGLCAKIAVPCEPARGVVVIQPFSGSRRKNWPLDRFRQVAEALPVPVEWIAGPEEELPMAKRIDDLWQLAICIGSAAGYIGNDSGITHLAAATGVPTVAVFGATDPRVWAPRGSNVTVVSGKDMQSISVERVLEAVLHTLVRCPKSG